MSDEEHSLLCAGLCGGRAAQRVEHRLDGAIAALEVLVDALVHVELLDRVHGAVREVHRVALRVQLLGRHEVGQSVLVPAEPLEEARLDADHWPAGAPARAAADVVARAAARSARARRRARSGHELHAAQHLERRLHAAQRRRAVDVREAHAALEQ